MLGFSEFTSEAGKGLFGITTEIKREKANVIKSGENQNKSSLHLYTVSHGKTWSTPRPLGGGDCSPCQSKNQTHGSLAQHLSWGTLGLNLDGLNSRRIMLAAILSFLKITGTYSSSFCEW